MINQSPFEFHDDTLQDVFQDSFLKMGNQVRRQVIKRPMTRMLTEIEEAQINNPVLDAAALFRGTTSKSQQRRPRSDQIVYKASRSQRDAHFIAPQVSCFGRSSCPFKPAKTTKLMESSDLNPAIQNQSNRTTLIQDLIARDDPDSYDLQAHTAQKRALVGLLGNMPYSVVQNNLEAMRKSKGLIFDGMMNGASQ